GGRALGSLSHCRGRHVAANPFPLSDERCQPTSAYKTVSSPSSRSHHRVSESPVALFDPSRTASLTPIELTAQRLYRHLFPAWEVDSVEARWARRIRFW